MNTFFYINIYLVTIHWQFNNKITLSIKCRLKVIWGNVVVTCCTSYCTSDMDWAQAKSSSNVPWVLLTAPAKDKPSPVTGECKQLDSERSAFSTNNPEPLSILGPELWYATKAVFAPLCHASLQTHKHVSRNGCSDIEKVPLEVAMRGHAEWFHRISGFSKKPLCPGLSGRIISH